MCTFFCALSVLIKRLCTLDIKCAQKLSRVLKKWGLKDFVLEQSLSCAYRCFLCTIRHTQAFFYIFFRKVCHFCHELTVHTKFSFGKLCTLRLGSIAHYFIRFQGPVGTGQAAAQSCFSPLGGAMRVDGVRLLATLPTDSGAVSGAGRKNQTR